MHVTRKQVVAEKPSAELYNLLLKEYPAEYLNRGSTRLKVISAAYATVDECPVS